MGNMGINRLTVRSVGDLPWFAWDFTHFYMEISHWINSATDFFWWFQQSVMKNQEDDGIQPTTEMGTSGRWEPQLEDCTIGVSWWVRFIFFYLKTEDIWKLSEISETYLTFTFSHSCSNNLDLHDFTGIIQAFLKPETALITRQRISKMNYGHGPQETKPWCPSVRTKIL